MKQTDEVKRAAKQLARMGYKTRPCRTCGGVEYKVAFKWVCGICKERVRLGVVGKGGLTS